MDNTCDICQRKEGDIWVDIGQLCESCYSDTDDPAFDFEVESIEL